MTAVAKSDGYSPLCVNFVAVGHWARKNEAQERGKDYVLREKLWLEASVGPLCPLSAFLSLSHSLFLCPARKLLDEFAVGLGQPINTRRQPGRVARNCPLNAA